MKRFHLIAAVILLTINTFAQDGRSIYNKYSDQKDVSAVYISPAMFRLIGRIPDLEIKDSDVNLAPIIRELKGMYILDSENARVNAELKEDVEKWISKGDYELLMEAKEEGEKVRIYTLGDKKTVKSLIFLAFEDDECDFICIDGEMDRESFEKLIAKAAR